MAAVPISSYARPPVTQLPAVVPAGSSQVNVNVGAAPQQPRPPAPYKPTTLDIRAEEDAARRLNAGRSQVGNTGYGGANSRARRTDLFDRDTLRRTVNTIGADLKLEFDEEALSYLAVATETRIRALLSQSTLASLHRTSTSHIHTPPFQPASTSSGPPKPGKPIWSHRINSDVTAVIDALNRQNKDAEQTFRADRMNRLARETEAQRIKERLALPAESENIAGPSTSTAPSGTGSNDVSTPTKASTSTATSPSGGTPTFGAVIEPKATKRSTKKGANLTPDGQHKMSNMTSMKWAGNMKSYSWLNAPNVSSPLAGKKRKTKASDQTAEPTKPADGEKSEDVSRKPNGDAEEGRVKKKAKNGAPLTRPSRRSVVVDKDEKGEEKKVTDDRAVTLVDLLFVLERDGLGRGMGTADEIVTKVQAMGGRFEAS
ncbi:hypothetical protein BCR39DRAFT_544711 [Naematelia encephala]|uniref:Transcription initiation factor TFIID subunit 4 n=1 Tax=Naematelia encephala TaxID=71784 RepID=A0A1Y2ATL2_9TREE|nr:hypothetical protein BCR39DRAFT_544711 [Naematelia encephala]